jgi:hypothetical protein
MWGGGGTQTLIFTGANDQAVFSGNFGGGFVSLGLGDDQATFSGTYAATTILGTEGADTLSFNYQNTVVFGSAIGTAAQVSFGANDDQATFSAAVGASSIYGGGGNDTFAFSAAIGPATIDLGLGNDSLVFYGNLVSGQFAGGGGDDYAGGAITVGITGVSFFGGAGADTFSFSQITGTGTGGTAYFWNEGGSDSILLGSEVSYSTSVQTAANTFFAVTESSSSTISFLDTQTLTNNAYSNMFGVAGNFAAERVSALLGTNMITLKFGTSIAGPAGYTNGFGEFVLVGANVEAITNSFSGFDTSKGTGTANWGGSIAIPTFS